MTQKGELDDALAYAMASFMMTYPFAFKSIQL